MTASSRKTLLVGGIALTAGGIGVVRAGVVDSDGSGQNDTYLNDDIRLYSAGTLMFLTGIVAMIAALSSHERVEPSTTVPDASVRPSPRSPSHHRFPNPIPILQRTHTEP